jgi:uncharacterized protein
MSRAQTLLQLHRIDQEWNEKARRYQVVRAELEPDATLSALREVDRDRAARLRQMRSELDDAELELAGLRRKAQEAQEALYSGRVRSPREVENLRQGAEQLREHISDLEDRALNLITEIEEMEALATEGESEITSLEQAHAESRPALMAEYQVLRARLQELKAARDSVRSEVPRGDLALYDQLRAQKGGVAMAPLKDGLCQVCRVSLPSYKVQMVEQGTEVVTCEGCGRILYRG